MFRSELDLDALCSHLTTAIRPDRDFLLLGMPFHRAARIVGHWRDDRVLRLMHFAELA